MTHWPQIVLVGLIIFGLGVSVAKHGQPTKYDGGMSLIRLTAMLALLYLGGFFDGMFQ